jgi:hypothetical protein
MKRRKAASHTPDNQKPGQKDRAFFVWLCTSFRGARAPARANPESRAFSVPIESERGSISYLTRFLYANRYPLRWKTLSKFESGIFRVIQE